MADEEGGDLLVLLLDLQLFHAAQPTAATPAAPAASHGLAPQSLVEQLLYFVGAYRLLHDDNQLAVFAVHDRACDLIYAMLGEETPLAASNNPYERIRDGIVAAMQQDTASTAAPAAASLSGGLSRALCLMHRLQASPVRKRKRCKPRILCIWGSPDAPMQYVPVMNAIFSAQRAEVAIDALVLQPADSGFLQQATHLTGGLYFRPAHRGAALQYLVQSLTAPTDTRAMLAIHQPQGVDFRASCFCHKRAIDVGYVCSVCLSIFCRQAPSCFICGTAFAGAKRKAAAGTGAAVGAQPQAAA